MASPLMSESIWFEKYRAEDAEKAHYERLSGASPSSQKTSECEQEPTQKVDPKKTDQGSSLVSEIAKARKQIQNSLNSDAPAAPVSNNVMNRLEKLEAENRDLTALVQKLDARLAALELASGTPKAQAPAAPKPAAAPQKPAADDDEDSDDDDDDFDMFGSEDEEDTAEADRIKEERIKAYNEKKSKKPALIAKSSVLFDIKPWSDETDMGAMEKHVRTIEMEGLHWGASKLVPLAYGIRKLQLLSTIVDDLVSTEELSEKIEEFEDYVQSVDIAAFNKI